ncbi:MAG: hypothetical protein FWH14_05550 [Oscillospiraceae bacterium]|nr:hypothetical protein [Oscillospiraceae bacterium]
MSDKGKTPAAAAAPSLRKRAGDYRRGGNLPPVGTNTAFLYPRYARGAYPTRKTPAYAGVFLASPFGRGVMR